MSASLLATSWPPASAPAPASMLGKMVSRLRINPEPHRDDVASERTPREEVECACVLKGSRHGACCAASYHQSSSFLQSTVRCCHLHHTGAGQKSEC